MSNKAKPVGQPCLSFAGPSLGSLHCSTFSVQTTCFTYLVSQKKNGPACFRLSQNHEHHNWQKNKFSKPEVLQWKDSFSLICKIKHVTQSFILVNVCGSPLGSLKLYSSTWHRAQLDPGTTNPHPKPPTAHRPEAPKRPVGNGHLSFLVPDGQRHIVDITSSS